ncbi:MAG: tRNA-dihydrouridine synthase family protein [Planctomycetes bacterium]|nr:tRNA-dihydrouridine synthase family protein [Planctomycetota bacterium]
MLDVHSPFGAQLFLAPMAGVTDLAYRLFMKELGAEVLCSELISAEGYVHGSRRTKEMMAIHEDEKPAGVQIFGSKAESMCAIATYAQDNGASFVDINCGCPVPKVTKSGAGSAMLKKLDDMQILLSALRQALTIPLSIKIRTGWDEESKQAHEIVKIAADCGVDWVSIHGRTREMGYSGKCDWAYLEEVRKQSPLPIIGNGDLWTASQAVSKLKTFPAVMVGRPVLANPLYFLQVQEQLGNQTIHTPSLAELCTRYYNIVQEHVHPKVRLTKCKKMFIWFSTGYQGKGTFRKSLYEHKGSEEEVLQLACEYFEIAKKSNNHNFENFLGNGHG